MSNKLTDAQTELLIRYAKEKSDGRVGIMHDANIEGDEGAKESLWRLNVANLKPYLLWSRKKNGARFKDREPESFTDEEWRGMRQQLCRIPRVAENCHETSLFEDRSINAPLDPI